MQKFLVYQSTLTIYSLLAIILRWNFFGGTMQVMWGAALIGFASQALVIMGILLFSFNRKITHKLITFIYHLLGKLHIMKNVDSRIESLEFQLSSFHTCNKELFKNRRLLLETYVCTAIQLTAIFIIPYCIYRSFSLNGARVVDMVASQAFVTMVSCFVPLPGAVLIWRLITYYGTIALSAPFSHLGRKSKREREEEEIEKTKTNI